MVPTVVRAKGAYLTSSDGLVWTDLEMGDGVHLFGHANERVADAIRAQLDRGLGVGPNSALAGVNARRLCALTGAERLLFLTTGSEAVMVALRLARARTQRRKVVIFREDFHGHFEGALDPRTPGVSADATNGTVRLAHRDERAFEVLRMHAGEIAAVLVEPVPSFGAPRVDPPFLRRLREWSLQNGCALIFNELNTGLRTDARGTGAAVDVAADMVVHGKFLGGGLPLGIVTGAARYLDQADGGPWSYGDSSQPTVSKTFLAGTFNKHPIAMAAMAAVLDLLEARGAEIRATLDERASQWTVAVGRILRDRGWEDIAVGNHGSFVRFQGSDTRLRDLQRALEERRILLGAAGRCFLSVDHDDRVLENVLDAFASLPPPPRASDAKPSTRSTNASRVRLFCIHPAGAAATTYRHWPGRLSALDVRTLELPGRGRAQNEPFLFEFEEARARLASEIEKELSSTPGPFALFGHSMGALLAFELARELSGRFDLRNLFLSGEPAPHIGAYDGGLDPRHAPDDELIERFLASSDRDLARALLPRLRADLAVCHTYRFTAGKKILRPLSVFGGSQDPLAKREDLERWRELTDGDFQLRIVEGDHAFVQSNPLVCSHILDDMRT